MKMRRFGVALLSLLTMATFTVSAQPGGGMGGPGGGMGGGRGPGMGGPGRMMMMNGTVDLVKAAGLFEIEGKTILKKVKIKDVDMQTKVKKLAAVYMAGYDDVTATQTEAIDYLKAETKALKEAAIRASMDPMSMGDEQQQAQGNKGGRTQMTEEQREKMQATMTHTRAIRQPMAELHKGLDNGMKALLSTDAKLLEKWTEFYKEICADNSFSTMERGQRGQGQGQRGQGGQQRQGGQGPMM